MNTFVDEVLDAIDNIDQEEFVAEMNVLDAMISSYSKSVMILEHYEGDDLSCFDIFQEGSVGQFIDSLDQKLQKKDGESILRKILLAIPRLFMKLINVIRHKAVNDALQACEEQLGCVADIMDNIPDEYFEEVAEEVVEEASYVSMFPNSNNDQTTNKNVRHANIQHSNSTPTNGVLRSGVRKVERTADVFQKVRDLSSGDKKKIGAMIGELAKLCATSKTGIEISLKAVDKLTSTVVDMNEQTKKLNDDLSKCSSDEKDAIESVFAKYLENMERLILWEEKVLHREGSIDKILSAKDKKEAIRETANLLSGFGEVVKDITVRGKKDQILNELNSGLNEALSYFNDINFSERTKDTKSKVVKVASVANKLVSAVNGHWNNMTAAQKSILKATSGILRVARILT